MKSKPYRLCCVIYIKKKEIQALSFIDMLRLKMYYLLLLLLLLLLYYYYTVILLYYYIVILCDYQRVMNTLESDSSYELRYIKGQNDNKNT